MGGWVISLGPKWSDSPAHMNRRTNATENITSPYIMYVVGNYFRSIKFVLLINVNDMI